MARARRIGNKKGWAPIRKEVANRFPYFEVIYIDASTLHRAFVCPACRGLVGEIDFDGFPGRKSHYTNRQGASLVPSDIGGGEVVVYDVRCDVVSWRYEYLVLLWFENGYHGAEGHDFQYGER